MTDNAEKLGYYSRKFKNLSKNDVYLVAKSKGLPAVKDESREYNMKLLLKTFPEMALLREHVFYFHIERTTEGIDVHHLIDHPDDTMLYPERVQFGHKVDIDKILRELNIDISKLSVADKTKTEHSTPPKLPDKNGQPSPNTNTIRTSPSTNIDPQDSLELKMMEILSNFATKSEKPLFKQW